MNDASEPGIKVKRKKVGRPSKGGPEPLVGFRLPAEKIARIEAVLQDGETRSEFLVGATDRELKRRERQRTKP